jgi:hypothetical protein
MCRCASPIVTGLLSCAVCGNSLMPSDRHPLGVEHEPATLRYTEPTWPAGEYSQGSNFRLRFPIDDHS